jgi:hypothetical protein
MKYFLIALLLDEVDPAKPGLMPDLVLNHLDLHMEQMLATDGYVT